MQDDVDKHAGSGVWRKRMLWLALIWTASVAALGVVAYAMKWVMRAIGMSP